MRTQIGDLISLVHLGLWGLAGWFSGPKKKADPLFIIRRAFDMGINAFDTAPLYGMGTGESLLGECNLPRDRIWITTKAGLTLTGREDQFFFQSQNSRGGFSVYRNLSAASIVDQCEDSLRRLKTDYIDLYLLHWPDPLTDLSESIDALMTLRRRGLIRYAGLSNHNVEAFLKWNNEFSDFPPVFTQNRYNLLQRKPETNLIPYAKKNRLNFMAYSPLAQGLLSDRETLASSELMTDDPRSTSGLRNREYLIRVRTIMESLNDLKEKYHASLSALSIAWTLGERKNRYAVAGAGSSDDCIDLSRANEIVLSEEDRILMESATEALRNEWK